MAATVRESVEYGIETTTSPTTGTPCPHCAGTGLAHAPAVARVVESTPVEHVAGLPDAGPVRMPIGAARRVLFEAIDGRRRRGRCGRGVRWAGAGGRGPVRAHPGRVVLRSTAHPVTATHTRPVVDNGIVGKA
jgi:hypothetical protein